MTHPTSSLNAVTEEKYPNLGGIYFPILQQDGSRCLIKISNGDNGADLHFLAYLRQHDRQQGATE